MAVNDFSTRVDERFEKMDERFDRMESKFENRFNRLENAIGEIRNELDEIKRRLDMIEKRTREDSNALAEVVVDLRKRLNIAERNIKELQIKLEQQKVAA